MNKMYQEYQRKGIAVRDLVYRQGLKELRKKRICSVQGCGKYVANNHAISRSLLKELADERHVYELFIQPLPTPTIGLQRIGIENSTVFKDLCPHHDNFFYQSIDQKNYDVYRYRNIIALNHRALRNEWFRKSVTYGTHKNCINDMMGHRISYEMMYDSLCSLPFNFRSINWHMNAVSKALNGEDEFIFKVFKYPYFEVAASELFTYEPNPYAKRTLLKTTGCFVPFSEIFLHIVPRKEEDATYIIVSSHKNDQFLLDDYIHKYIDGKLGKCLSDILLIHIEKWVCSRTFKNSYVDNNIDFLNVFKLEMPMNTFDRYTDENLFVRA